MGRRSRKRNSLEMPARGSSSSSPTDAPPSSAAGPSAASKPPTTPRRRARMEDAPPAPWGKFPLVELCILAGIVLVVWGFLSTGSQRGVLVAGGIALVCVASLELVIREHFAGFRSHTLLLSAAIAVAVMALVGLAGVDRLIVAAAGVVAGALAFGVLRRVFMRRAGGLGFRA